MDLSKIGYLRVSTEEQRPDRQIIGLESICDALHIETVSAVSKKRPVYDKVVTSLKSGDSLVVWDLDRAFRSTVDALLEAEKLRERNIAFQIVTLNVDTATPAGELVYTVMAAFAQYERKILIKRTREGLAAAIQRGVKLGRPAKLTKQQILDAQDAVSNGYSTITAKAKEYGVCRDTLRRCMAKLGQI